MLLDAFGAGLFRSFERNAHVTDEHQLSAPEAKMAIGRLQNSGISIHLQMPVQEGINFWRDDLPRSVDTFRKICRLAYETGVVPYKAIIDMHSSSHPDLTVPIETFTKVIGFLDSHEGNSDMERWQAYNILHEQGNLYLSSYPHFTAVKEIRNDGWVSYYIPKVEFGSEKRVVVHTYTEPLIPGHNDNPDSLNPIADADIRGKISEVKDAHHLLQHKIEKLEEAGLSPQQLAKEIYARERAYNDVSGIRFPENKPLHFAIRKPPALAGG